MKISRFVKYLMVFVLVLVSTTTLNYTTFVRAEEPPKVQSPQLESNPVTPESVFMSQLPNWARLVDIRTVNPNIRLDIRYATTNNFLKRKLYTVAKCALRSSVAQKLALVQTDLEKIGLGLKVYDCYRPFSVTKQMWEFLPDPNYVANPVRGSRHNRGAAVDLTLVDRTGKELEMPTPYDDFTKKAHRDYNGGSAQSRKNRQTLEDAMKKQGFIGISTEWWHFDSEDWQKFAILDVSLSEIP
ncbi:MAG: M15 family metallopeptidase [Microcoleus sp. PH2017_15_JOR_U_A]|uniref:M15 family metallopeptidase n=1 Tax=unclassified Microcoleus TaxID=2642155 RepID=UPI001D23EB41|nr:MULTISPECIES: M15 family metallopeptidase [unclassified Microcoleus]MCC3472518.1 M15 family metallopeptidase [Microcoleus sp. PH2017_13_LAR_U_A]MCC3484956.1 M15 family metallopeptidase [Microcoleus sp. PH2017_14_LAR_D_A]MCC3497211.1 M15 family metallopeptidase [Microcoleus sp. PH2017_15_JOR_U_A]MCC3597634.1 M15 family metallopeptidase [Microcoleus sp. PH2017_26_ELK_O_A]MCC3622738.1 M15 family metallopeptidase [Microcoleus sp. PH2017_36_ELK_O_B]